MDMYRAKFKQGILSQGEIIRDPEEHRLIAKKAWLQLYDFFLMNDEPFKALKTPLPWSLEDDLEIKEKLQFVKWRLSRFNSEASLRDYVNGDEDHYEKETLKGYLAANKLGPRMGWVAMAAASFKPMTVLDVGVGYGNITVDLAKRGISVTGVCPNPIAVEVLNEVAQESELAIQAMDAVFEATDFGDTQFDVVIASEVLEHVAVDSQFLSKCCALAKKAVIITVPKGSVECGFIENSGWIDQSAHVRAYTERSLTELASSMKGFTPQWDEGGFGKIQTLAEIPGHRGQPIECYCLILKREIPND